MILGDLVTETTSRAHWRRPVGELLVIVTGVLLALWVENWRESVADRGLEREYVARLAEDLLQDSAAFDDMLGHVPRTNRAARLLLDLVQHPSRTPEDRRLFASALEEARSIQNNPWADGTYAELLATGNMSVLQNGDLKSKLNVYYLSLEGLYTWVERRVDRSFRNQAALILPADVREGVYLRHFWSWDPTKQIPTDAWLESAALEVDVAEALTRLRSIQGVDLMLARVVDLTSGHVEYLEHSAAQQQELLGLLRAELAR